MDSCNSDDPHDNHFRHRRHHYYHGNELLSDLPNDAHYEITCESVLSLDSLSGGSGGGPLGGGGGGVGGGGGGMPQRVSVPGRTPSGGR